MNCSLYQNNVIPFFMLLIAFQKQDAARRASSKDGFAAICSHRMPLINVSFTARLSLFSYFFASPD